MTNLVGPIPDSKGDVLTTTNNGQGLNTTLANVQDGDGNNSAVLLSTEQFQVAGGYLANRTAVTTASYNVLSTDYIIAVTVNAAGVDIILPAPSADSIGQVFVVQDEVGNATIHTISVHVTGGALINGSAFSFITTNYGSLTLYSNGTAYFLISKQFV